MTSYINKIKDIDEVFDNFNIRNAVLKELGLYRYLDNLERQGRLINEVNLYSKNNAIKAQILYE